MPSISEAADCVLKKDAICHFRNRCHISTFTSECCSPVRGDDVVRRDKHSFSQIGLWDYIMVATKRKFRGFRKADLLQFRSWIAISDSWLNDWTNDPQSLGITAPSLREELELRIPSDLYVSTVKGCWKAAFPLSLNKKQHFCQYPVQPRPATSTSVTFYRYVELGAAI